MNAVEILRRMGDAYRLCDSYRDSGTVRSQGVVGGAFATSLIRSSGRFSFDFNGGEGEQYSVRSEHGELLECRLPPTFSERLRSPQSLELAIATMTGLTLGSSHIVPRMLLAALLGGRSISSVAQPSILREESLDGETCAWIELGAEFPDAAVLVNNKDFTLRRFLVFPSQPTRRDSSSTQLALDAALVPNQEVTYHPHIA